MSEYPRINDSGETVWACCGSSIGQPCEHKRRGPESYGTIWVCQDCMLHHANGECGGCHDDNGHDQEPLSSIEDGFHVTMGMVNEEHSCGSENGEHVPECDCDRNTYSTSQCEGCGSYLHGERHAMTLFKD